MLDAVSGGGQVSRETALRILESGTTSEAQLKRAELYLYLDRTKALKVDKVWLILERTGGGSWGVRAVYIDEQAAQREYESLSLVASRTANSYWEVDCKELPVS
jgi:hypothetical protein